VDIFGAGEDEESLRRLAGDLHVEERVCFHGPTDDPRRVIRNASMLVLPSRAEGMPNVVLEAMAEGRPVVATGIGGTNEVVVHGETGLLVPPDDPRALAEAMRKLTDNAGLQVAMGQAGWVRAKEVFSHERVVDRTLDLYTAVCEQDM
jgi:glycosyltransferase involved in cell wall biosynthesis